MDNKKPPSMKTESGAQLFARLNSRPPISNIEPLLFESISAGDIIEISGEAGCGKTELLYHFIVRCIFPKSWQGLKLEGLDTGVIFVDNDYHFNLFRLISIIEKRILHLKLLNERQDITDSEILQLISDRLRLLHVIKCASTDQFLITLHSLENILAANSEISCLMIDSVSAFYWIDRMNLMHQLRKLDDQHYKLILLFKKLINNYSLTIFATKQKLMKKGEKTDSVDEYDFMSRRWQRFCTHCIELSLEGAEKGKTLLNICCTSKNEKKHRKCIITESGIVL